MTERQTRHHCSRTKMIIIFFLDIALMSRHKFTERQTQFAWQITPLAPFTAILTCVGHSLSSMGVNWKQTMLLMLCTVSMVLQRWWIHLFSLLPFTPPWLKWTLTTCQITFTEKHLKFTNQISLTLISPVRWCHWCSRVCANSCFDLFAAVSAKNSDILIGSCFLS